MNETEKALLAIFSMDNSLLPMDLEEDIFTGNFNKVILRKMKELKAKGKEFDMVILADELTKDSPGRQPFDPVPVSYIASCFDYLHHLNPKYRTKDRNYYIELLRKEKSRKEITRMANDPSYDTDEIIEIARGYAPEDTLEDGSIENAFDEYIQLSTSEEEEITIGFPGIDRAIGGLRFGELFLIMGRTTTCKTWILLHILRTFNLRKKETIGLFSLEMPRCSIIERLFQLYYGISREEAKEKANIMARAESGTNQLIEFTGYFNMIKIYDRIYSVGDLVSKIRSDGLKILVIDFLTLFKSDHANSPYQRITQLITELKHLAKEERVLIILAHQLSRLAGDGSIPVTLNMARDSGAVEELSDFILGLWRPEIGSPKPEAKNKVWLKLLKNKRGETTTVVCHFNKKTGKIRELDSSHHFKKN